MVLEIPAARLRLSLFALSVGYVAALALERGIRYCRSSGTSMAFSDWNFIAAWFAILGVMGWITFGVPCLVFGSLPDRIRNLRQAFVLGGLAGTAILLLFLAGLAAIFGRDLSTPDLLEASMLYIAYFGPCAFVFGGVGTATYIALLGRL